MSKLSKKDYSLLTSSYFHLKANTCQKILTGICLILFFNDYKVRFTSTSS